MFHDSRTVELYFRFTMSLSCLRASVEVMYTRWNGTNRFIYIQPRGYVILLETKNLFGEEEGGEGGTVLRKIHKKDVRHVYLWLGGRLSLSIIIHVFIVHVMHGSFLKQIAEDQITDGNIHISRFTYDPCAQWPHGPNLEIPEKRTRYAYIQ